MNEKLTIHPKDGFTIKDKINFWDGLEFNDLDSQLMVMAAHRYCLGRQSYIVGSCISWLEKYRHKFERNTIRVIVRDTAEAIIDDLAGSKTIDMPSWRRLASLMYEEMPEEDKEWCLREVNYRGRGWPLAKEWAAYSI